MDATGQFTSRGEGQLLSGSLLGADLDAIAEVKGVEVLNDGSGSLADPTSAVPLGNDAYSDPLNVEALSALNVDLTRFLALPLDTSTGVVGQYGQATSSGLSAGASGLITESGGIALEPEGGYPNLATLQLSQLLGSVNPGVASALSGVADVSLEVGAVTGRAELDACNLAWSGQVADALTREYLATSLTTVIDSPTVGTLVSTVDGVVGDLETAVNALAGDTGLTTAIADGLSGLLGGLLGTLRLGDVSVELSATIDLDPVRALLTEQLTDSGGILTVDLAGGTIRVDTAALLAASYPDEYSAGLNGLSPNTNILSDPVVVNTLTSTLASVLDEWLERVTGALTAAVDAITVNVAATIELRLLLIPVAEISVSVSGSLAQLLSGEPGFVTVNTKLLGAIELGLLNGLVSALTQGAGLAVGTAVDAVLGLTVDELIGDLVDVTTPVVEAVSLVYSSLFLDGVVVVTVNAQNDPLAGSAEPPDLAALPDGQFDVAALRVGVLDALGQSGVALYLGRGSVGPSCLIGAARC
ncbi:choice-of-anchor G family protein [Gulosibacter molinativorax]|uniref:Choice-of-anchor G family protein n=1 Tax=Gulosibacter molinativorax TaxID=256821 RepID=A0ABT7C703_9MICO|nr:choice-of-anchor G family protein [Gulosibacter molinativorax]MDJ1370968.1 hypothetical protein [Gulosibacter molinativorax]QUY62759.1 Hypotetical protein [Gulosibacter molinativorax]